jgi:hypothetical protein
VYNLVFNTLATWDNTISIAPNPFNSTITVEQQNSNQLYIELLDLQGRVVASETTSTGVTHLPINPQLPAGTYLLRIQNEKGNLLQQLMVKIAD